MEAQVVTIDQPFHSAYEKFMEITSHLSTETSCDKTHSEIEAYLETDGRELLRLLLQDHLDTQGPSRLEEAPCGSDGVVRSHKRDRMETGYKYQTKSLLTKCRSYTSSTLNSVSWRLSHDLMRR